MLPNCFPTDTLKKFTCYVVKIVFLSLLLIVALKKMMKQFKLSPKKYINALIDITYFTILFLNDNYLSTYLSG